MQYKIVSIIFGFLPLFGDIPEDAEWFVQSAQMIEYYSKSDIVYYGNTEILDFTQNLVRCVLEYTRIRMLNEKQDYDRYRDLKERFLMEPIPTTVQINPLVKIIYYDYLGLTYKRLYRLNDDPSDLQSFQRR